MPIGHDNRREILEQGLKTVMDHPYFAMCKAEYDKMLDILGNVDGDEALGLAILVVSNLAYDEAQNGGA